MPQPSSVPHHVCEGSSPSVAAAHSLVYVTPRYEYVGRQTQSLSVRWLGAAGSQTPVAAHAASPAPHAHAPSSQTPPPLHIVGYGVASRSVILTSPNAAWSALRKKPTLPPA